MSGPQEASGRARSGWRGWVDRLFTPVDIASLVYFRIVFGAVMLWEVTRYFQHDWIRRYWIEPAFNFTYYGFEWAKPLPGDAMYGLWFALGLCALAIMVGFAYRAATVLFFLGFTYSFLLEQARYLNHFYLVSLIAFLMIWLPAHRRWSLDARANPKLRTDTVPAWTLGILQFQIAIVYFFGGVAKLNPDWLQARPIGRWLAARGDLPLVGPWLETVSAGYFFAYSGLLFDLLIVPALLWKRTRVLAFLAAVGFHLTNAVIFEIGIFPWFGLAATALFFPPDWPRRFVGWAGGLVGRIPATPSVGANGRGRFSPMYRRAVLAFVLAWGIVQVGLPLRHWMYPGSPSWTEEGHNWAWHMKLRSKKATATFTVQDTQSGRIEIIDPTLYLTRWQARKMSSRPDMIVEFAHHLAQKAEGSGWHEPAVYARVEASLNGHPSRLLIDPTVNLVTVDRSWKPADWIKR
ncbi:MAG: HTTM domain-containing protein [Bacteroidota bacterium]